ncbi:MAG: hypothetical protein ACLP1D_29040 [Xanthobacteraceae bacterium]
MLSAPSAAAGQSSVAAADSTGRAIHACREVFLVRSDGGSEAAEQARAGMADYGLLPSVRTDDALYLRGYGPGHHIYVAERGAEARSIGFALAAKTAADLDKLSAETGAPVELINEPGGGKRVVLTDPSPLS